MIDNIVEDLCDNGAISDDDVHSASFLFELVMNKTIGFTPQGPLLSVAWSDKIEVERENEESQYGKS